jgi:UDP-4-amino-4,6-dideoxy-N-acetyl-beta-L-altrosamine N-acetyltransferase
MIEADLALVLKWRTHPDVRKFMYTQHVISPEEHARWFEQASHAADRQLLIFEIRDHPLGFVGITALPHGRAAKWGFYVAPGAPKGTGRLLGRCAIAHIFSTMGMYKLSGETLGHNERSIRLHRFLGFKEEGVLREQHFDGTAYRDIICFGLLEREWRESR